MASDKQLLPQRSVREWAKLVRADLDQAVGGIIGAGRHLNEAFVQLGKGRYGEMLKLVGINEQTAQRLRRIASNPALTKPENLNKVPVSMRTLSELARIAPPILEGYIADGTVYVEMERSEAERLVKGKSEKATGARSSGTRNRQMPAEPKLEAWAQSAAPKPSAEKLIAKQAAEAEAEAQALAAKEQQEQAGKLSEENWRLKQELGALKSEVEELKAEKTAASPSAAETSRSVDELIAALVDQLKDKPLAAIKATLKTLSAKIEDALLASRGAAALQQEVAAEKAQKKKRGRKGRVAGQITGIGPITMAEND